MKDNRKDLKIDWNEFLRWFDATMKRYGKNQKVKHHPCNTLIHNAN